MKIVRRVLYIFTVIRYMNLNRVSFSSLNLLPLDQRPIQYVTLRFFYVILRLSSDQILFSVTLIFYYLFKG